MSILPEGLRRWVDLRPAGVAAAAVNARARLENHFLLFPPLMFAFALSPRVSSGSVWDDFFRSLVFNLVYATIFVVIWRGIWSGRIPERLSWKRIWLIALLACLVGKLAFPLLAAVGAPRLAG